VTASAAGFSWLLAARLLAGIAAAGVSPSVYALVSSSAPGQRRASRLALVVSGLLVSLVLGAPLGGLAGATIGWRSVFAGLAFFSLPLVWVNGRIWPADEVAGNSAPQPDDVTIGILVPQLAPMVAWSTALYGMYTYLGFGLTTAGLSTAQIAGVIAFYGYGALGGILMGGRAADLFGARLTSRLSLAGLCASFLVLRLALNTGVMIEFTFALASAVAQMFFPAQQSALANDFPQQRATVLAWNNSALFLGISLGSLVGGQAVVIGGFPADLTSSAVIALAGWALTGAAARPRRAIGRAR
jgi:predicted MFS family arabinose efflux permease